MPKEKGRLNAGGQWVKTIYNHIKDMLPATETQIYRACFEMDGLLPDKVDDFLIDLTKMGYIKYKKETYYLIDVEVKEPEAIEEKVDSDLQKWRELKEKKEKTPDDVNEPS